MQAKLTSSASATVKRSKNHLFFVFFLLGSSLYAQEDCAPQANIHPVKVAHVYDGDTVKLSTGKKVRLIGINTPEVAGRNRAGEPFGQKARRALYTRLKGKSVFLEKGVETRDRYKRLLAHLFLADGSNISAWLVEQGYAYAHATPPNLKHQNCYHQAELRARQKKRGIWGHAYFSPRPAEQVKRTGFMRVRGCAQKTRSTRKAILVSLSSNFALRIRRQDAKNYLSSFLKTLKQQPSACFFVEGWVYNDSRLQKKIMNVSYPDAIQFIPEND